MEAKFIPVSVIIPCFCSAATIERAVNSVICQTYSPMQIILIDDASSDDSFDVLLRIQKDYPEKNIVVDRLDNNSGPGIARNRGWELATQTWLAFLDADDAWHAQKLEIQWDWLAHYPNATLVGHLTKEINHSQKNVLQDRLSIPVKAERINLSQMVISNRFFTRTVLLKRDLPFSFQDRRYTEDYLLWLEIVLSNRESYVLNQCLAFSFRPEYSSGGYSGQLWKHEMRELRAWVYLYKNKKIPPFTFAIAYSWSYVKYLRRVLLRGLS